MTILLLQSVFHGRTCCLNPWGKKPNPTKIPQTNTKMSQKQKAERKEVESELESLFTSVPSFLLAGLDLSTKYLGFHKSFRSPPSESACG